MNKQEMVTAIRDEYLAVLELAKIADEQGYEFVEKYLHDAIGSLIDAKNAMRDLIAEEEEDQDG